MSQILFLYFKHSLAKSKDLKKKKSIRFSKSLKTGALTTTLWQIFYSLCPLSVLDANLLSSLRPVHVLSDHLKALSARAEAYNLPCAGSLVSRFLTTFHQLEAT